MIKMMTLGTFAMLLGTLGFLRDTDASVDGIADSDPDPISEMLETIRIKHGFPALATAVVVDGEVAALNAVGFRKHDDSRRITVEDKFHIGSVTKSMTATVAAMMVEQGQVAWTTTVEESFQEFREEIHPRYLEVTLEQLLANRGGAPGDAPRDLWADAWRAEGTPAEQRLNFAKGLLSREPEAEPGTQNIYSNQGYAIAGVMLEKAGGETWETLMRSMLFEPLQLESAGFGAPATPGQVDQPWGHTKRRLLGIQAVPPGPGADNPPAIGPAGTVHCSLGDLAKYTAFHLAGARGQHDLLEADSFQKLHTPLAEEDNYALGWVVLEREWAGGRVLMHNGSNTMFYVVVWIAPERNLAVMAATNIGVDTAEEGCDEAVSKLISHFPGQ